jgi:2'-5' RNA ligase
MALTGHFRSSRCAQLDRLPETVRAFVAIRMSAEVESAIAELINPLRKLRSGTRWVPRENLHLTLRFLGDSCNRNLLSALDRNLELVAAQTVPFVVNVRGTGAFPNLHRPRIVWVGLTGAVLFDLAQQIEAAARKAGFAPESRPYSPHLTIGRVRDLAGWQRIRPILDNASDREFGSVPVSEMILYRSILGGQASQYQEINCYPFDTSSP